MKNLAVLFIIFFTVSCSKPKTVLICGDHVCVNKAEAKKFFEENLSLEVQVIDKKENKEINLVELNLKQNSQGDKVIIVSDKKKTKEEIRILTKEEIKIKKEELRSTKKVAKNIKKSKNKVWSSSRTVDPAQNRVVDICLLIDECNIQEISKYLIKRGKKKGFPDITIRE